VIYSREYPEKFPGYPNSREECYISSPIKKYGLAIFSGHAAVLLLPCPPLSKGKSRGRVWCRER
jgi:hypothetical protein